MGITWEVMKMNEFEKFVKELNELPKIDTSFTYIGDNTSKKSGVEVEAIEIKHSAETKEELEQKMRKSIKELIEGKRAWVRIMPILKYDNINEKWVGRARFAIMPKEVSTPFINIDNTGHIVKDDMYNSYIESREKRNEAMKQDRVAKEEAETKRRASLTPKERTKEDIERYLRDVSYDGEYDFETLEKLYREYIKSP